MTEKEKMIAGKIYDPSDKELVSGLCGGNDCFDISKILQYRNKSVKIT